MRAVSMKFLLLASLLPAALACKTESAPPAQKSADTAAPAANSPAVDPANPHAGLDPAVAARAEAARAAATGAGGAPQATAGLQPRMMAAQSLPELAGGRV